MPQKAPSDNPVPGVDPHITPWGDDHAGHAHTRAHPSSPQRMPPRTRSLKDWAVLFLAILLGLYVITFLLVGSDSASSTTSLFSGASGTVAIIPVQGEIGSSTGTDSISYLDLIASLKQANDDASVKAILLDIDSPGGSVVATKQVVAFVRDMNKPIVSWIGDEGASGAYYLAAASTYIVADPDSITGSVGVRSEVTDVSGLLEKLGVKIEDINAGTFKTIGSPYKELTPAERSMLQDIVDQAFGHFKNDIIAFRKNKHLDLQQFDTYADGRIITGQRAFEAGMIDQLGTRQQAILKAAALGGINGEPETTTLQQDHFSLKDLLFSSGQQLGQGFASGIKQSQTQANTVQIK